MSGKEIMVSIFGSKKLHGLKNTDALGLSYKIELEIPSKDFLAGKVFGNKPVSQQAQPVRPSATLPATASTSSFYGKPATATTSSFYGSSTASKAIIKKFSESRHQ